MMGERTPGVTPVEESGCGLRVFGCLLTLGILAIMAALPIAAALVLGRESGIGIGLIIFVGTALFTLVAVGSLLNGRLVVRGSARVTPQESPGTFYIGVGIYAFFALASYVAYLLALFFAY